MGMDDIAVIDLVNDIHTKFGKYPQPPSLPQIAAWGRFIKDLDPAAVQWAIDTYVGNDPSPSEISRAALGRARKSRRTKAVDASALWEKLRLEIAVDLGISDGKGRQLRRFDEVELFRPTLVAWKQTEGGRPLPPAAVDDQMKAEPRPV